MTVAPPHPNPRATTGSATPATLPALVVDDDEGTRTTVMALLASAGVPAVGAASAREALDRRVADRPCVALIDFRLPDGSGVDLGARLKADDPDLRLLLITGNATLDSAVASVGSFDEYLVKPVAPPVLIQSVKNAIARRNLEIDNRSMVGRLQRLMAMQALYDPLTSLPNRLLLEDRLRQVLASTKRDGTRLGVLFVDLDGFKTINDTLGHPVGDQLLRQVGERLAAARRQSDTVARFGGDEFIVVCPQVQSVPDLARIAEEILGRLAEPFHVEGVTHRLSASVGVVLAGADADDQSPEVLIRNADTAMYRAKELGRSCWALYDETLHDRVVDRFETERGLREGLGRGEFELVYQPLVSLPERALVGAEALLRWRRPGHGLVLPGEFLPVAEDSGLVVVLGSWVLEAAVEELARWRAGGLVPPRFRLWVNVSPKQIAEATFPHVLADLLAAYRLPAEALGVEIIEEALHDVGSTTKVLHALRELGVSLSLDDFGAGHSNLAWLQELPITGLKIDRRFIAGLDRPHDDKGRPIVRGMLELGHALKLSVVGEGVETESQAAALAALGCELAQGYHFGRPGSVDELFAAAGPEAAET